MGVAKDVVFPAVQRVLFQDILIASHMEEAKDARFLAVHRPPFRDPVFCSAAYMAEGKNARNPLVNL